MDPISEKLKELYDTRAQAIGEREKLLARDVLSEDDISRDKELEESVKATTAHIDKLEAHQADKRRDFAKIDEPVTPSLPEKVEVLEPNFLEDPKKGFRSLTEFFLAVKNAGDPNYRGGLDKRLAYLSPKYQAAVGSDEQMIASDPYGGFTVPVGLAPGVLSVMPEDDFLGRFVRRVPMTNPRVEFNARVDKNHTSSVSGGLTFTRTPEATVGTSSRMQFEQVVLDATELVGLTYATNRLLTYSADSFVALLAAGFSDELTGKLTDERLNGSGTGEFQGVLNSPAKIAQAEEATQTNATIIYENVINMRSRCWGYESAIWVANHDTLPQLMTMNFTSSAIAPIWQPSLREDHPDMLLGRPIFFTEFAQTLGTEGDIMCLNLTQYLEGTLQSLQSAESIHVRFESGETAFRFSILNDARGWWLSELTPAKSTTTLSPFVTLATRS